MTYRNKEARRSIVAVKGVWKQLQPCIIAIHDKFAIVLGLDLCQPRILGRELGRGVAFINIENEVHK